LFFLFKEIVVSEIYDLKHLTRQQQQASERATTNEGMNAKLTPTFESKFRPSMTLPTLLILLTTAAADGLSWLFMLMVFVFLLLMLLLLLFIWLEIVQMFSFGLSLPTETGRGLSEHGDASRETDSESSSLSGFPMHE